MLDDARFLAPQHGKVIDDDDPEGLHRVRVEIPGLIEKSAWAFPVGTMGGGGPQRGIAIVPKVGSDVVVWFIGGDKDRPIYASAWWGKPASGSEMPTPIRDVPVEDAKKIQAIEIDRLVISYDEREDRRLFSLEDKVSGDSIVWDLNAQGMRIELTSALIIKVFGALDIDAAQVTIKGRQVYATSRGI